MSNTRQSKLYMLLLFFIVTISSCRYSFKGINIAPDINTFYVTLFDNSAPNAPASLPQVFSDALTEKIRSESRLRFRDLDPDITFSGSIIGFNVSAQALQAGQTTAFNKLSIKVKVNYTNSKDENNKWTKTFDFFENFPSDQNLLDVQDRLIEEINNQLVENIFNYAFTDW